MLGPRPREHEGYWPSVILFPWDQSALGDDLLLGVPLSLVSPSISSPFGALPFSTTFCVGTWAQALTSCCVVAVPIKQGLDTVHMRIWLSHLRTLTGLSLGSSFCAEGLSCLDSVSCPLSLGTEVVALSVPLWPLCCSSPSPLRFHTLRLTTPLPAPCVLSSYSFSCLWSASQSRQTWQAEHFQ